MSQILETAMLICFGCSWPISVYQNIKAKSAKTMSLKFTVLIILGYVAGITAKLITHSINYVLVVYIINLAIVSVNIAVYFINRKYDREEEQMNNFKSENATDKNADLYAEKPTMSDENKAEMKKYSRMNKFAKEGSAVLFGTNFFKNIDFGEYVESYGGKPIYNRSFTDLRIEFAADAIKNTLSEIEPSAVFVNLGETEINDENFNADSFIEKYRWLLYTMHRLSNAKIYIVPVISNTPNAQIVNQKLKMLSNEVGCDYVNALRVMNKSESDFELFKLVQSYIRTSPISFVEAMSH